MRIRTIRPEFYKSDSISQISWDARLVFMCLWSYVTDNGVGRDNVRLIRGECFPMEDDSVLPRIESALKELEQVGCIIRYQWEGKKLLCVPNFRKYQHITKPGTMPYPTAQECGIVNDSTLGNYHSVPSSEEFAASSDQSGCGVGVVSSSKSSSTHTTRACETEPEDNPLTAQEQGYFDQFWALYPKKAGKRDAMFAFKRALRRAHGATAILAGVTRFASDPNRPPDGDRYLKSPKNWLEGDCWKDGPYAPNNQQQPTKQQTNRQHNLDLVAKFEAMEAGERTPIAELE